MHSLLYDFCPSDQRFARGLVDSPHPASFRFHLTMDTLAFGYILPATGRIQDFHPLETCAARRTTKNPFKHEASCLKRFPVSSFKDSVNFYSFSFKTMLSKIFKVTPQITAINTGDVQSIFIKGDREFAQSA